MPTSKTNNSEVILAQIKADIDPEFSALLNITTSAEVVDTISATVKATVTDTSRLRPALLLGAQVRVGLAKGLFLNIAALAKAVNYSVPHLNLCGRLYDGKPHMIEAAAWANDNRAALVREHEYTVDGKDYSATVGFSPRKSDGIEWQIAANDAYAMFRRLRRDHEEDEKIVGALSEADAITAVRDAYTNIPKAESKEEKNAKRKAKILADAIKFGVTVPATPVAPAAPIEVKTFTIKTGAEAPETLEMPITIPGKRHAEKSATA
jgi:hypothetical protein